MEIPQRDDWNEKVKRWGARHLLALLAVGISAAAAAGLADDALVLPNGRRITRSMITGHRGDARALPENTLMAFRRAVDNGFCFECDFYMTNDGEVYCVHDMNLKRTFGIAGRATNVCWKGTLDKVDVGAIKGPQFAGRADCRVPRIDEVFALIPDDGRKITLEVKDPRPEIVPLIQAAWRRHPNMKEENIIFLAHKATRAALVKAFPRATFQHCVNCYSDGWRKGCTPIPVDRQLAELDARPECRNFSPMFDLDLLTSDYIASVHTRGVTFYTWCVDRPEDAVEVFGRGVDGICSNCPLELWDGLKAMCATSKAGAQAMQKNGEVWYDTAGHAVNAHGGGVLAHGGKYYLYGEHKVYGRAGNKAHVGVHIYSSDDLEKWKDEGIALKVEDKPGHDIEDGCVLERPKILFCDKTGKFVMFFHLELKGQGYSAARVGIAVADKATGPYRFLRSLRPNAGQWPMNVPERDRVEETKAKYMTAGKKAKLWGAHFAGGQMSRDMTLFKDDDGKAWHIFSSEDNSTLHIAELTDDYLDYTGRWWRAAELDWTEAAAVCQKDGWYYLIGSGCTGWKPNTARCYRAKSITGPWERLGNPCKGVNPANGLGPDLTWGGQSNYILKKGDGEYIAMFDIWKPDNQIDSRLVWLPIDFNADGTISIEWKALTTADTRVEFRDCPKCDKRIRIDLAAGKAYVNLSRLEGASRDEVAARAARLLDAAKIPPARDPKLRPLMGWSSWNTFGVDISETIILETARALATNGLKEAGYTYVNIDDGFFWGHGPDGVLRFHPERFPNGMKPTVDGIHALGLKAGIYSDAGADTCGSMWGGSGSGGKDKGGVGAGLYGHDAADCKLHFNVLGFDFIKVDYCGGGKLKLDEKARYTEIANAIKATGRTDVRLNLCRWAFPGTWAADIAESWRTTKDIRANWKSVKDLIGENLYLGAYARPGHYNDMDMLEVGQLKGAVKSIFGKHGDTGLTPDEELTHFGMWCMLSSPLLIGCDVRTIPASTKALITNPYLLAMNQNDLGLQGYVVSREGDACILVKDAGQKFGRSRYVALYNGSDEEHEFTVRADALDVAGEVDAFDLVEMADAGRFSGEVFVKVAPHATKFYRIDAERRIQRTVYEAESAFLTDYQELRDAVKAGTAFPAPMKEASGGMYVRYIGNRASNDLVWKDVKIDSAGGYVLAFDYAAPEDRSFDLSVDGGPAKRVATPGTAGKIGTVKVTVPLSAGVHVIRLSNATAWMPDLDRMTLRANVDAAGGLAR